MMKLALVCFAFSIPLFWTKDREHALGEMLRSTHPEGREVEKMSLTARSHRTNFVR